MSTRSGKRIHASLHENILNTEEVALKSERKTRSKYMKENIEETNIALQKFKKRENYVSYPTDDEQTGDANSGETEAKLTRTLRKNALKELNPISVISDPEILVKTRSTRRTRKFAENPESIENEIQDNHESIEKTKKSKRKKLSAEGIEPTKPAKKKNKKKKGKVSNTFVSENMTEEVIDNIDVNKSNISNDSFHSAAGSPSHPNININPLELENMMQLNSDETNEKKKSHKRGKKNAGSKHISSEHNLITEERDTSLNKNGTFEVEQPRRSSLRHDVTQMDTATNRMFVQNCSFSKDILRDKNDTFDIELKNSCNKRNSSMKNLINESNSVTKIRKSDANTSKDISHNKNDTFEIENRKSGNSMPSIRNTSIEAVVNISDTEEIDLNVTQNKNSTFEIEQSSDKKGSVTKAINTTYEKDTSVGSASKSRKRKLTMDIDMNSDNSSPIQLTNKTSSLNSTYDKADVSVKVNTTFELKDLSDKTVNKPIDTSYEKETQSPRPKLRKSGNSLVPDRRSKDINRNGSLNATFEATKDTVETLNGTFNKSEKTNTSIDNQLNTTFDKVSKSSLISSDSNMSRISITSDESISEPKEAQKPVTIMNITPVLIDSSMESLISEDSKTEVMPTPLKREGTFSLSSDGAKPDTIPTPVKREGTFTKDGPDDPSITKESSPAVTPKKKVSLPSPGCTPFPNKSSTKEKPLLNVTRSIEKRRSIEPAPRITRVMFCSPVNNPVLVAQQKRTVIKSNLKGSNKSFVYEENVETPPRRKRSHTLGDAHPAHPAHPAHHKRTRLADELQTSVDRLSRPRTSSANAKLTDLTPTKKSTTPSKAKVSRTKLPNFAALHQKQFDKMESLDECQERKAKRAKQLLTLTPGAILSDKSPKVTTDSPAQPKEVAKKTDNLTKSFSQEASKKTDNLTKSFSQEASKQKYTRFGFKLNLDVNPFSIPSKNPVKPKESTNGLKRQATLPSLAGATSVRREVAKQMVMREKSFSDKRLLKRSENRTIIKGVRTNRRFELQMKLRNIE